MFTPPAVKSIARIHIPLLLASLTALQAAAPNPYFGISSAKSKPTGFFRLAKTGDRYHLVTPDGRPYLALGINHLDMLQLPAGSGQRDAGWVENPKPQLFQQ